MASRLYRTLVAFWLILFGVVQILIKTDTELWRWIGGLGDGDVQPSVSDVEERSESTGTWKVAKIIMWLDHRSVGSRMNVSSRDSLTKTGCTCVEKIRCHGLNCSRILNNTKNATNLNFF